MTQVFVDIQNVCLICEATFLLPGFGEIKNSLLKLEEIERKITISTKKFSFRKWQEEQIVWKMNTTLYVTRFICFASRYSSLLQHTQKTKMMPDLNTWELKSFPFSTKNEQTFDRVTWHICRFCLKAWQVMWSVRHAVFYTCRRWCKDTGRR